MKNRKWSLFAIALIIGIGCVVYFHKSSIPESETIIRDSPFNLPLAELSKLDIESKKGNCVSAYKLGQYHLYSSLDVQQAEKYFRLAVRCEDADALVGLITVLRKPEHDAEIDNLLATLKKIDPQKGESASEEIALRRAERKSK